MNLLSLWHKQLIIILLLAAFFHGKTVYVILFVFLILQFVVGWSMKATARQLVVERTVSKNRLFPGETASVQLTLTNNKVFPLSWLHVIEEGDPSLLMTPTGRFAFSLSGKDRRRLHYTIEAKRRGQISLPAPTIETGDPFGLHQFIFRPDVSQPEEQKEIVVYPRIRPVGDIGFGSDIAFDGLGRAHGDREDPLKLMGTRDYVVGESLRHVHWKASAHVGSLQVKTFEGTRHMDVAVLLDLRENHYPSWNVERMSELAIETAASIVYATNERQGSFSVITVGKLDGRRDRDGAPKAIEIPKGRGDEHVGRVLETLARVDLTKGQVDLEPTIADCARRLRRETTFVVVTPAPEEALASIARIMRATYRPVLIIEMIDARDRRVAPLSSLPRGVRLTRVAYDGDISKLGHARLA